jgi:AraC-like DNA-binding protein
MTTATGFGPLPDLLVERCGERAVQRVFASERLPLVLVEDRRHLVPFAAMLGVFEQAARRAGNRTFGFDVGAGMSEGSYGVWLDYAGEAPTLGDALRRAVSAIRFHQTVGRLSLDPSGGSVVWRYWPPPVPRNHIQHSDHVIAPMIRVVTRYAGPGWRPRAIEVNYPRDPAACALERRTGVPIRFGAPAVGIEIPVADLGAARTGACVPAAAGPLTLREVAASSVLAEETEPLRSMRAIVALRLMEGRTDIEGAAAMAGIGVQAVQRRLREAGLSYRDVVGAARLARAEALLRETDLSVTEIALELGYNEHANFTRAFRRATGLTPTDFRSRARPLCRVGRLTAPR